MDNTPCGCALRCFVAVPEAQRKRLFNGFWESASFDIQNAYICGCVKVVHVTRRYTTSGNSSRRSKSRLYFVNNGSVSVKVCKTAFLRIHAISNGRLDRALKASAVLGGSPHSDQRGRHEPGNKTSENKRDLVKRHIESVPKYQSHYSRSANPHRQYLSPSLSLAKMYLLYKEKCAEDGEEPVSDWVYRKVFNEEYNLSFGR